ncbi:cupin 2 conserved barrel domain protein [Halalkaliarchaeum desulfuricum]|uniref:Cupin 2 conserved barrel domain protein n=1 Tax=Halalkaliarchaeum desulfuricum TaxID=2055893 RepID=A0A343TNW1_9EURY|nr:cupin domain-containing protein [Halalkaliarchaeum desulfuricum]AUX10783.1 cupin 2 conserved barrel domain protein [Halalkaliarchaeum desulfuricum]
MEYHVVDPDVVDPEPDRPSEKRSISDAAELDQVGVHVYGVAPGEQVPYVYHYHDEQEEILYVLEGTLSVETPEETFEVEAGQAFVVEPESPHRAYNPAGADAPVRLLAVGAPAVDDAHEYEP